MADKPFPLIAAALALALQNMQSAARRPPVMDRTLHRALALLAANPEGLTDMLMLAHGFTRAQLNELVEAGLATTHTRTPGGGPVETTTLRITDAGRVVLESPP